MERSFFPFPVPQVRPSKKLENIKKKIGKFQKDVDYSVSFNGRDYVILSNELRKCLRLEVWENKKPEWGEYYDSGYFFYKMGEFNGDLDTFKVKNETFSPQIKEIDDDEVEKINQENSEKEKKLEEDVEMTETESSTKIVDKFDTNDETKNNHQDKSGGKYNKSLFFGGLFLLMICPILILVR